MKLSDLVILLKRVAGKRDKITDPPEEFNRSADIEAETPITVGARCPKCNSPEPRLHPAVQYGGEVQICSDPYYKPEPQYKVGDHVRIKEDAEKYMEVRSGMRKYLGKTVTVTNVHDDNWWLQCDNDWHWHPQAVELAPEPQYRPYSDLRPLVGKALQTKDGNTCKLAMQATVSTVWLSPSVSISAAYLLENYTHLDGTPCGELVE